MTIPTARPAHTQAPRRPGQHTWLTTLRRYLVISATANFIWEMAQLPFYTLWTEGTVGEIAFGVVHCTAGDVLIATASLVGALVLVGRNAWPHARYRHVAGLTLVAGLAYTVLSEWINTEIRGSWAYSDLMPVLPVVGTGLTPLLQWLVVPLAAFYWARPYAPLSGDDR